LWKITVWLVACSSPDPDDKYSRVLERSRISLSPLHYTAGSTHRRSAPLQITAVTRHHTVKHCSFQVQGLPYSRTKSGTGKKHKHYLVFPLEGHRPDEG